MENKNYLKEIADSLSNISLLLFFMLLLSMCSRPSMTNTNNKLEKISIQLEKIANKEK